MGRTVQTKKKAKATSDDEITVEKVIAKKKTNTKNAKPAKKTEEKGEKKKPLDPAERFNRQCYQGEKCQRKACLFLHDKPKEADKPKGNKKPAPLMRGGNGPRRGGMGPMRGGMGPMGGRMGPMGGRMGPMGGPMGPMRGGMGPMGGRMGPMGGGMGPMGGGMGRMGGMDDMGDMQSAKMRKMEMMKQELEDMMMSLKGSGGGMGGGYGGGYGGSMGDPWKKGAGPMGYGGGYGY